MEPAGELRFAQVDLGPVESLLGNADQGGVARLHSPTTIRAGALADAGVAATRATGVDVRGRVELEDRLVADAVLRQKRLLA